MQRQVLLQKAEKVTEIKSLFEAYKAVAVANLYKVRASQLQELRRKLEGTACFRVIKNSLARRAVVECRGKTRIEELNEYLEDSNLFVFTNLNPFKLALLLEKSKVKDYAKVGDIATEDIVVPAGNTGIPPGPIISQLGSVGIPTRIESGSVFVNRNTIVAKKGEAISESLAPVLSKLGIKPIEMGLSAKVVYDDGIIISGEELKLNPDEYNKNIGEAFARALNLSLNAAYPMAENILALLQIAVAESRNLVVKADIPVPEIMPELITKAYAEAMILDSEIQAKTSSK